jgi:ATP-dependent RNA helicase DeaD
VRVVVESLAGEFDVVQIAAAAVKLALQADGRGEEARDEREIPAFDLKPHPHRKGDERGAGGRPPAKKRPRADPDRPMARLFVGAGRAAGIRPGDLVGAITGETGHDSGVVGSIEINDRFSIVEVPKDLESEITAALRGTKLRGRKVKIERDRGSR